MQALHRAQLPPTGVSHALSVRLTLPQDAASVHGVVVSHLITARQSVIQIWEVREFEKDGQSVRASLQHVLTRRLHGIVTSLSRVRTLASKVDGADRVLISFKDAKLSLLEWDPSAHDLIPVSLHTFEKLPQVIEGRTRAATDPASRVSVLLLPSNTGGDATLAVLPFFQEELDLESLGVDAEAWGTDGVASIPYAPSHLLPLSSLTASLNASGPARSSTLSNALVNAGGPPPIRNVIDMVFLPGFNEPTLAMLYSPELTWNARLENFSNNCLVSLVTLASDSAKAGTSETTTAVVIATSPALPHSCLAVYPCPPDLGGTLVLTANGILHLEQGGKVVGVASNGWFSKEWTGAGSSSADETVCEDLEGAKIVFIAHSKAIVSCKSGTVLELALQTSGRTISGMSLTKVGAGVAASCVERIRGSQGRFGEQGYVFVGSEVGESTLLRWDVKSTAVADGASTTIAPVVEAKPLDDMELDYDEDDIYGSSETKSAAPMVSAPTSGPERVMIEVSDVLQSYGAIRSMVMGLWDDESNAELVASTGGGLTAGLTVFHRCVSPRKRRRVQLDFVPTAGMWSIPTNTSMNALVVSNAENTRVLVAEGDGYGEVATKQHATVAAASILGGTNVLRVTPTQIQLLDSNLDVLQLLPLGHSSPATRAVVSDPYIAVYGASNKLELFYVDAMSGLLAPHIIPAENAYAISLFVDSTDYIPIVRAAPVYSTQTRDGQKIEPEEEEDDLYATAPRRPLASETTGQLSLVIQPSLELGAMPQLDGSGPAWQWLPVIDETGTLQIFLLPGMQLVFSSSGTTLLPEVIEDGKSEPIPDFVDSDDIKIDRVVCANIGQTRLRPHLLIYLTNGALAVYEAFPSISSARQSPREATLGARFVKTSMRRLPAPIIRKGKRAEGQDDLPPPKRDFVPFSNLSGFTGLFSTGEDPVWIIATDHGPAQILDHADKGIYGFAVSDETGCYTVQTRQGAYSACLPSDVCFDREVSFTRIPKDRRYASVAFDLDSGLYVAGGLYDTVFVNFDDEGQRVFTDDSPDLTEPHNYRSTLELIVPGSWDAIDGYEFRPNEFISTMRTVSLATRSTATGRKDYIAVGTTVYRAEDLAARGGVYLFEVIKIVPDESRPERTHRLKLMTFEDTKSVVGNICDINGHLVMSMGQKLYARAFEQDEVLVAVGFLDVGVHVTSLQSLKNFILLGDALQSVSLVAFQEDPYKLVLLGRDYRPSRVSSANFLVDNGKVAFVVGDLSGVVRMFEYDPSNIASHAGQRLLCRTEYYAGAEAEATLLYARRTGGDDVKQNGILYGGIDGSIYSLVPVRDIVFKRLQLLQAAMMRHVLHFAGLNPRGHRIVKNDSVSRAITKGILDGELLAEFEWLPLDRQIELCESVGTDSDTVLANLRNLGGLW